MIKKRTKNKTKEIKYKSQYGIIAICETEEHQKKVFEELQNKGLKLKVVTV